MTPFACESVSYRDVLHDVDLELRPGRVCALLGPSGAGKTTLLKTATGALDSRKGKVLLDGKPIQNRDPDWVARQGIAHVPEGRGTFGRLSTEENLILGAFSRRNRRAIRDDLDRVYQYFPPLAERRTQQAGTLSGGEQQMLAIGRTLMGNPDLLLVDEPTEGLAPVMVVNKDTHGDVSSDQVIDILEKYEYKMVRENP